MKVIDNTMSFEDYKDIDLINKSSLNNFVPGNSPRQSLYQKSSSSQDDGTAFHSVMEFGIHDNPDLIISPYESFRTNEAKLWKAKQTATVVKQDFLDTLELASTYTHAAIGGQMGIDIHDDVGNHEVTVLTDTEKIRIDYTREEGHFDWKSTASANPVSCMKDIENYNYDLQAYMYSKVYKEVTGDMRPFYFVFQEIKPSFNTTIIEISENTKEAWAVGKAKYAQALDRYHTVAHDSSFTDKKLDYTPNRWVMEKYGVDVNPFED